MSHPVRPNLPEALTTLSEDQQRAVEAYAEACVDHALHSVDSMLDAATHVVSFLPGWLINRLAPKYIDPILSARTAEKLTLKQAIKVSGALPTDYLADAASYMPPPLTTQILLGLSDKHATNFVKYCREHYPSLTQELAEELKAQSGGKKLLKLMPAPAAQATDFG